MGTSAQAPPPLNDLLVDLIGELGAGGWPLASS